MKIKINRENFPLIANIEKLKTYQEKFDVELKNIGLQRSSNEFFKEITDIIFSNSPYLSNVILKNIEFYLSFFESDIFNIFNKELENLRNNKFTNRQNLEKALRQEKNKMALLIAFGEITGLFSGKEAMECLSKFADLTINKATDFLLKEYSKLKLIKLEDEANPILNSGIVILAQGKLGSFELNYSSDIDLCVFFEDEKLEYLGRKSLQQQYIQLAKDITDILSRRTADGYVFRVDMRLRPDPASNPLAVSLDKAEIYYFTIGQNWERAAMIRSRFICGDEESYDIFKGFMDKNIWRKSLDFETIEDIHSIKRQIDTKQGIHPEKLFGYNLKLGKGGIREIEFFVQTQQLIWGGRKPNLRKRDTIEALKALEDIGEIDLETAQQLEEVYNFYRMVEHRLQMVNDEQTHSLPKDSEKMEEIAKFCGFENKDIFIEKFIEKISIVKKHYSKLFETSPELTANIGEEAGSLIFTGASNHPDTLDTLAKLGYKEPQKISEIIRGWHYGRYNCTEKARSRAVLTKLIPSIVIDFSKSADPDSAFIRFDEFLSRLPKGSQIFSMLLANPSILKLLSEIMGGYPKIAKNLTKNVFLLDYVLAPEFYSNLPKIKQLEKNLDENLREKIDIEEIYETIKDWSNDRKFRVGIQFIRNQASVEETFRNLTNIAEVAISKILEKTIENFEAEIGHIEGGNFAVIAMGKLGSKELTFESDLDLVFVYEHDENVFTVENSNITPISYYTRIANKIIYALSSISVTGKLYDVDLRLRPLGDSGPVASNLKTFDEYYNNQNQQNSNAWLWEYLVLTKARLIGKNKEFNKRVETIIRQKLFFEWEWSEFDKEIEYIYTKFRDSKKIISEFDIKNTVGGLFDLEFMIRYLQLKNLAKLPEIESTETVKTIHRLSNYEIIDFEEASFLKECFHFFSVSQAILRLTSEEKITPFVENILSKLLDLKNENDFINLLEFNRNKVRFLFEKYLNFIDINNLI